MTESFCKQQVGIDPEVLGYQILVKSAVLDQKRESGLLMPDSVIKEQSRRQNIGLILKIGPSAFKGNCEDRLCNVGDWIAYSNFERSPEYVGDHVLYYISDAHVIARYTEEDLKKILDRWK